MIEIIKSNTVNITCKYSGHRTNDDGSCRVSFNRPDGLKYYVDMPVKFNGPGLGVLDWIREEEIEIFLTKKFNHDAQQDKYNNIKRKLSIHLNRINFWFDSYDGHIEIYNAYFARHLGLLDSLKDLFDFEDPKFTSQFIEKVKEKLDLEVKTIQVVKTRYDLEYENIGEITSKWEQFNRNKQLEKLFKIQNGNN